MVVALEDTSILVFTTVSPVRKRILQAQLNGRPRLSDAEAQMPSARTSAATRTSAQRPLDFRLFPSAITSSLTLAGVDGRPEILLYSKGFSEVDQTTETADGPIFGL